VVCEAAAGRPDVRASEKYCFYLNRKVQWTQDAPRDTMIPMITPPRGVG
jgi:hypothetical protein